MAHLHTLTQVRETAKIQKPVPTTTYIINTFNDFHQYFNHLKDDAMMGDTQKIYVIGLDTEFICQDNYPESFEQSINWLENNTNCKIAMCTLQIASNNVCMVINLTKMGKPLPKKLVTLLTSDSWVKFGIGIENDLRILSLNYGLGHCSGSMELKSLALMANHPNPNLEFMYNQFVGGHVKKTNSIHDWTQDLTDEQISYAARDAIMSYQVGMTVLKPTLDNIQKVVETNISNKLQIKIGNNGHKEDAILSTKIEKSNNARINYIGQLNEYLQNIKLPLPVYEFKADGSTTQKVFVVKCTCNGHVTTATGLNKRDGKNESARLMLNILK